MSKLLTVACRLPHGIVAEVGKFGESGYKQITINGPFTKNSKGELASLAVNGYAFTKVPDDFWMEWERAHKNAEYIKNRMVYAEDTEEKTQAATKQAETAGKSGFEALDPNKPPAGVEVDKDHMKRVRSGSM